MWFDEEDKGFRVVQGGGSSLDLASVKVGTRRGEVIVGFRESCRGMVSGNVGFNVIFDEERLVLIFREVNQG